MERSWHAIGGTLVLGAFLILFPGGTSGRARVAGAAVTRCDDISGVPLAALPTQSQLNVYALGVVTQLTAGTEACWLGNDWQTKAGLGLEPSSQTASPARSLDAALEKQSLRRLLSELRPPAQVVARKLSRHKNFGDDVPDPRLTSIDYNSLAASAILKLKWNASRGQGITTLPPGSVIVKTIWERADLSRSRCINLPASQFAAAVITPGTGASGQRAEQQGQPGVTDHLKTPFTSMLNPGWRWVGVSEDGTSQTCKPGSSALPVQRVSTVYNTILQKDPYDLGYTGAGDLKGAGCQGRCLLALLGVNLMVKAREGPDWIWIALWWTGVYHEKYNEMDQNSPWRYYEIGITETERDPSAENSTVSLNPNILFNPFLEGTQPNGTVANCKTCHQYAAVDPKNRSASLRPCGTGPTLGGPPLPALDAAGRAQQGAGAGCGGFYDTGSDPKDPHNYLNRYLSTDSLWSLAAATEETEKKNHLAVTTANGKP